MSFGLGVLLFALAIAASIMLHEAGHLVTAKRFGMKATQYFVGFGPTIFSFRRGETEYGLKAIPAGGFVKIIGMTSLEEVAPDDEERAFYRQQAWKRTIVLSAGSAMHFVIAFVVLYGAALTTGLPINKAVVGEVSPCVVEQLEVVQVDGRDALRMPDCAPGDTPSPATVAGLLPGDRVLAVDGEEVDDFPALTDVIRSTGAGPATLRVERDGREQQVPVELVAVQRPAMGATDISDQRTVGALGVGPAVGAAAFETFGPVSAIGGTFSFSTYLVEQTFVAIGNFPEKIPPLVAAVTGAERDPNGPISVVGASRLGGQAAEAGLAEGFLLILAGLNVFIGIFNLFPLLPLDGGHIAVLGFENARSRIARALGRVDPGRVDITKLLPLTYVVVLIMGGVSLLAITADVVNPIANPFQ